MKQFLLLPVVLLCLVTSVFGQSGSFKIVPLQYGTSTSSPLLFTKGDTLKIETDSVYLVNAIRYSFYRNLHKATLAGMDSVCTKLLNAYELRLVEHEQAYSKLL
jgi:hypothetical protein